MKKLICTTMTILTLSHASFAADIFIPKTPGQGLSGNPGIGLFEQKQIVVITLMKNLGWDDQTQFEETGLNMRTLLQSLAQKDVEAFNWLKDLNTYFSSAEFQNQTLVAKTKEIFDAKILVKMTIKEVVLAETPKHIL